MSSASNNDDDQDPWADLFAKAAGNDEAIHTIAGDNPNQSKDSAEHSEPPHRQDRKRKGRRSADQRRQQPETTITKRNRRNHGDGSSSLYQQMLQKRMSVTPENCAEWFQFGYSFVDATCNQSFQPNPNTDSDTDNDADHSVHSGVCSVCQQPAIYHSLQPRGLSTRSTSKQLVPNPYRSGWIAALYCTLRDIRCIAKWCLAHQNSSRRRILLHLNMCVKGLESFSPNVHRHIPSDEHDIIGSKIHKLLLKAQALERMLRTKAKKKKGTHPDNRWHLFEPNVSTIIAADALYYRLYYIQVSDRSHFMQQQQQPKRGFHLPHPIQHFGSALTMELNENTIKNGLAFMNGSDGNDAMGISFLRCIRDNLSLLHQQQQEHAEKSSSIDADASKYDHPLAMLHRLRYLETVEIFGTWWISHKSTIQQFQQSSTNDRHDTRAPQILMDWRDSCRDFLCNLYCYATLSPIAVRSLVSAIQQHSAVSNKIVEMGAGTGYFAKLLRDHGLEVDAWDVCPTESDTTDTNPNGAKQRNEYHGDTPPYVLVRKGSSGTPRHRSKKKAKHQRMDDAIPRNATLLLCYPPPQSSMAYDCLKQYAPSTVIHVGEFGGLTGDAAFEQLLLQDYVCHPQRWPCLAWGTDASHVTIWTRQSATSLLLPCVNCGNRESTKRCRFARHATYCSASCVAAHTSQLEQILRIFMVTNQVLDFHNLNHFVEI